jgi:hypothetical protein
MGEFLHVFQMIRRIVADILRMNQGAVKQASIDQDQQDEYWRVVRR